MRAAIRTLHFCADPVLILLRYKDALYRSRLCLLQRKNIAIRKP